MTLPSGPPHARDLRRDGGGAANEDPRIVMLDVTSAARPAATSSRRPTRTGTSDGDRRAEHAGRRRGAGHDGADPVHQHLRLVRGRPAAGPDPGAHRPAGPQRQDHARLRRPVHRHDRHEPHHRRRRVDHAGHARHGDRGPRGRRGGRPGAPLGSGVPGARVHPAHPGRDPAPVRRRLPVRVRQGGRGPRGPGRDADQHRRPDAPDRGRGGAARPGRDRRPRRPRADDQAHRRRGDRRRRGADGACHHDRGAHRDRRPRRRGRGDARRAPPTRVDRIGLQDLDIHQAPTTPCSTSTASPRRG